MSFANSVKITTNNHRRRLIFGYELTETERAIFDFISDEEIQYSEFFRYKGELYYLTDFLRISEQFPNDFSGWDGYASDSYFSGIVVRYPRDDYSGRPDFESVIVGWYCC